MAFNLLKSKYTVLLWLLVLILYAYPAYSKSLFTIEDPAGDDHGCGDIVYPDRSDWKVGDLDLREFSAETDDKGILFTVKFANRISTPENVISPVTNQRLNTFIKEKFYNINVELYIDTDAVAGSGNIALLPGRKAEIDSEYAWEKAVIVTPRPQLAKKLLTGYLIRNRQNELKVSNKHLNKNDIDAITKEINSDLDNYIYFSTRNKVNDRKLSFFVPFAFLKENPKEHWRYILYTTGSDPEPSVSFADIGAKLPYQKETTLMLMPVKSGRPSDAFGLNPNADPDQPPIVDLLLPSKEIQYETLKKYTHLVGVNAKGEIPVKSFLKDTPEQPNPKTIQPSLFDHKLQPIQAKKEQNSILIQNDTPVKRTIAERLKELDQLFKEKLITEKEYHQFRKKILSDL